MSLLLIFFYNLIKKLSSVNIPIYLVRDKVYFPSSMKSIVLEKSEEILLKKLRLKSIRINSKDSLSFDFKKKVSLVGLLSQKLIIQRDFWKISNFLNKLE